MREAKRITLRLAIVVLLAFVSFNQLFADDDTVIIVDQLNHLLLSCKLIINVCVCSWISDDFFFNLLSVQIFHETFDESFSGRWIVSEKEDYKGKKNQVIYRLVYFGSEVCNLFCFVLFVWLLWIFFNFVFNCNYERVKAEFFSIFTYLLNNNEQLALINFNYVTEFISVILLFLGTIFNIGKIFRKENKNL